MKAIPATSILRRSRKVYILAAGAAAAVSVAIAPNTQGIAGAGLALLAATIAFSSTAGIAAMVAPTSGSPGTSPSQVYAHAPQSACCSSRERLQPAGGHGAPVAA